MINHIDIATSYRLTSAINRCCLLQQATACCNVSVICHWWHKSCRVNGR